MFYPSSCFFAYACLEKDYAMALLCCLDWVTSKEDHVDSCAGLRPYSTSRFALLSAPLKFAK